MSGKQTFGSINELYDFVRTVAESCRQRGYDTIANELSDAMSLGSSGTEILGAIRSVLLRHASTLQVFVDKESLDKVVRVAGNAYSRLF